MAARTRSDRQREALRRLVACIDRATERRESAERGSDEHPRADEALRQHRRVLLDDELFARYLEGYPRLDPGELGEAAAVPAATRHPRRRYGPPS